MKSKLLIQQPAPMSVREKQRRTVRRIINISSLVALFICSGILSALVSQQAGILLEDALLSVWGGIYLLFYALLAVLGVIVTAGEIRAPIGARLKIIQTNDRKAKAVGKQKAKHGIDVTLDDEHIYHIRGLGNRTGGRALLDLAGVYALRYWLTGDTRLNLRFYDMYTQQDHPDWEHDATGTGSVTLDLADSRYEFIVRARAEDRHIDPWELELEPIYAHALTEEFSQQIDEAEGEISASQGFTH